MIKIFSKTMIIVLIIISLTGCPVMQINKVAAWENEIQRTDEAFSQLSSQHGMKQAFQKYIDRDTLGNQILLLTNHPPLIRGYAIDYINQMNDTASLLTLVYDRCAVSASGDLGYSYGTYSLQIRDTVWEGPYVTIWKQQKDSTWKIVLHSENTGTFVSNKN